MSLLTSTQDKGPAGRALPELLLLLLLLLLPGSWALPKVHELQSTAGQQLSVRCQYPPASRFYEKKGWCKEVSALVCTRLVTSSRPWTQVQVSRFSIWDDPVAGFFTVTMTSLREEDSGHYRCKIYHASGNSVSKSVKFYLAVSPAPTSTQATWALPDLVSSQTQSCVPPAGGATETLESPSATTAPPQPRSSTPHLGPAVPKALLPVLYGLLLAKGLLLPALLLCDTDPHTQKFRPHLPSSNTQGLQESTRAASHGGQSLLRPAQPRPSAHGRFPPSHGTPTTPLSIFTTWELKSRVTAGALALPALHIPVPSLPPTVWVEDGESREPSFSLHQLGRELLNSAKHLCDSPSPETNLKPSAGCHHENPRMPLSSSPQNPISFSQWLLEVREPLDAAGKGTEQEPREQRGQGTSQGGSTSRTHQGGLCELHGVQCDQDPNVPLTLSTVSSPSF
ncbi:trem-like transcript 2 protein [Lemur catta]|uniref:trem-like transcript 2 protein n=1 Tax=Lemur catta TaxID=9447 RepID=UPI001E26A5E2|nr:trem-like transcript 2 protein [Lemur catta]